MSGGLVSIIMPVRNGIPFLDDALSSIIEGQTYSNFELIVVNDGSTDGTVDFLTKMFLEVDNFRWYNSPGKGILDALNFGYSQSKGDFITRMDADDLMSQKKLEVLVHNCEIGKVPVGQVQYFSESKLGDGYRMYADWLNNLIKCSENFRDIYKECTIPSCCWMLTRQDFDSIGGFGSGYPEDYDIAFRMRNAGLTLVGLNEIIHKWRDHSSRASRNDPNYADNRFYEIKLHYLMDEVGKSNLGLLGAGGRGKDLAKLMIEKGLEFNWFTNNPNKIGHDIYGKILKSEDEIVSENLIVAIAGEENLGLRSKYPHAFFFA